MTLITSVLATAASLCVQAHVFTQPALQPVRLWHAVSYFIQCVCLFVVVRFTHARPQYVVGRLQLFAGFLLASLAWLLYGFFSYVECSFQDWFAAYCSHFALQLYLMNEGWDALTFQHWRRTHGARRARK